VVAALTELGADVGALVALTEQDYASRCTDTERTSALPSTRVSQVQHRGYLSRGTDADHYEILDGAPVGKVASTADLQAVKRSVGNMSRAQKRTMRAALHKR
jgi:hypothetical protein